MKKVIMFCLLAIFFLHGPAFSAFNFIDNGDGTVTDGRTGLVWLKDANPCGTKSMYDAMSYCSSLTSGMAGLTDGSTVGSWRLPSKGELEGIGTDPPTTWYLGYPSVTWTMPGAPFTNVMFSRDYWSSTYGWYVDMQRGNATSGSTDYDFYVWPVRGPVAITTTTTTLQPSTTTTICDVGYWKAAYEQSQSQLQQCQAELQACQNQTTTTTAPTTNIELSVLDATPADEKVILQWKTETETGNAGFNIWRADNFVKVNNAVIPALGSPTASSDYDFIDQWVLNGKRYFYLLEDIDTDGISTFHGPVKATPRWIYGAGK